VTVNLPLSNCSHLAVLERLCTLLANIGVDPARMHGSIQVREELSKANIPLDLINTVISSRWPTRSIVPIPTPPASLNDSRAPSLVATQSHSVADMPESGQADTRAKLAPSLDVSSIDSVSNKAESSTLVLSGELPKVHTQVNATSNAHEPTRSVSFDTPGAPETSSRKSPSLMQQKRKSQFDLFAMDLDDFREKKSMVTSESPTPQSTSTGTLQTIPVSTIFE
jgi:hypothetical protein